VLATGELLGTVELYEDDVFTDVTFEVDQHTFHAAHVPTLGSLGSEGNSLVHFDTVHDSTCITNLLSHSTIARTVCTQL
jgi:hypothetical protein